MFKRFRLRSYLKVGYPIEIDFIGVGKIVSIGKEAIIIVIEEEGGEKPIDKIEVIPLENLSIVKETLVRREILVKREPTSKLVSYLPPSL